MSDYTTFDYQLQDGIAVVTFSRPERMNTFTTVVMAELLDLFDRTDVDDAVRVARAKRRFDIVHGCANAWNPEFNACQACGSRRASFRCLG